MRIVKSSATAILMLGIVAFGILTVASPVWANEEGGGEGGFLPPGWLVIFFVAMLLAIAILPLKYGHWWESNLHKGYLAAGLGIPMILYYLLKDPVTLLHTGKEYISFIMLLFSLFMCSGGIVLSGDLKANPLTNTLFLLIGALLASLIGTTGASMLLIYALITTNQERQYKAHTIIFFIFLVSNIGGSLLPIGDPPLFLGYLKGVPFFWTLKLFPIWLVTAGLVLGIYYIIDSYYYYRKEQKLDVARDASQVRSLLIEGRLNFLWLFLIIAVVAFSTPNRPFLSAHFGRELIMLIVALLSLFTTPKALRAKNKFTYNPIIEVAVLFIGIFATMIPTLQLLNVHAIKLKELGWDQPWVFFWATGALSSFLDNAPTYLTFLSTAQGLKLNPEIIGVPIKYLMAISAGAVFMGANSYIGNAPNFMVKTIAEERQIKMPSFFGYMKWSIGILIPVFILVTFIFF